MNRNPRKYLTWMLTTVLSLSLTACGDDNDGPDIPEGAIEISMGQVAISLTGIDGELAGYAVVLRNTTTNSQFTASTDAQGKATFQVTPGLYEASVNGGYAAEGIAYSYNGTSGIITVKTNETTAVTIEMKSIKTSQIVVKELYNGGCMMDDGVTKFQYDKCIILYNNSSQPASLSNLCIGEGSPANG